MLASGMMHWNGWRKKCPNWKQMSISEMDLSRREFALLGRFSNWNFTFWTFFLLDNNMITIRNPFKVIRTHWKWNHSIWQMKNPNTKLHWQVWRRTSYIVTPSERVWLIFQSVGFKKAYNSIFSYLAIDFRPSRNPWQRNIHDTSSWNG